MIPTVTTHYVHGDKSCNTGVCSTPATLQDAIRAARTEAERIAKALGGVTLIGDSTYEIAVNGTTIARVTVRMT